MTTPMDTGSLSALSDSDKEELRATFDIFDVNQTGMLVMFFFNSSPSRSERRSEKAPFPRKKKEKDVDTCIY